MHKVKLLISDTHSSLYTNISLVQTHFVSMDTVPGIHCTCTDIDPVAALDCAVYRHSANCMPIRMHPIALAYNSMAQIGPIDLSASADASIEWPDMWIQNKRLAFWPFRPWICWTLPCSSYFGTTLNGKTDRTVLGSCCSDAWNCRSTIDTHLRRLSEADNCPPCHNEILPIPAGSWPFPKCLDSCATDNFDCYLCMCAAFCSRGCMATAVDCWTVRPSTNRTRIRILSSWEIGDSSRPAGMVHACRATLPCERCRICWWYWLGRPFHRTSLQLSRCETTSLLGHDDYIKKIKEFI